MPWWPIQRPAFVLLLQLFIIIDMSATIRRYVALQEDFIDERGLTPAELKAAKLRMNFLKKFIIGFDTYIYKTQVERDWAYIAKRYCKDRT
jgi:hypothetical protein